MKKQRILVFILGLPANLFGAAHNDYEIAHMFDTAKLAIWHDMPGALASILLLPLPQYEEEVKGILEYALRVPNDNAREYAKQLTDHLQVESVFSALVKGERTHPPTLRRSSTLSLMDVAILRGNVVGVRDLLRLKPDLSKCRLLANGDKQPVPVLEALERLIAKKSSLTPDYSGQKVTATVEQLREIRQIIQDHQAAKASPLKKFAALFSGKK